MTGDKELEAINDKTPEQIDNQLKWSMAQGVLKHRHFDIPSEMVGADQLTLKSKLAQEQADLDAIPVEQRRFYWSPLIHKYQLYLDNLRDLRRSQRQQIESAVENRPEETAIRGSYERATEFPQELAKQVVESLQPSYTKLKRIMTDEEVTQACKTEQGFSELVLQAVDKKSGLILENLEILSLMLNPMDLKHAINRAVEDNSFSFFLAYDKIKDYFDADELRNLIERATYSGNSAYRFLGTPEVSDLFPEDKFRELVSYALDKSYGLQITREATKLYMEKGYLTQEQLGNKLIALASESERVLSIEEEVFGYLTSEQIGEMRRAVTEALKGPYASYSYLRYSNPVLTDEDKKNIIDSRLQENPNFAIENYDLFSQFIPIERINQAFIDALKKGDSIIYNSTNAHKVILSSEFISEQAKRAYINTMVKDYPTSTLGSIDLILPFYPEAEHPNLVRSLLSGVPSSISIMDVSKWINYISSDKSEQKIFLKNYVLNVNSFNIIYAYISGSRSNKEILHDIFTQDEMVQILYQQAELGIQSAFSNLPAIRELLGSDQALKQFLAQAIDTDPYSLLANFDQVNYLYSPDEIKTVIENAKLSEKGISACIESLKIGHLFWIQLMLRNFYISFLLYLQER